MRGNDIVTLMSSEALPMSMTSNMTPTGFADWILKAISITSVNGVSSLHTKIKHFVLAMISSFLAKSFPFEPEIKASEEKFYKLVPIQK